MVKTKENDHDNDNEYKALHKTVAVAGLEISAKKTKVMEFKDQQEKARVKKPDPIPDVVK
eukprot:gene20705-7633_t